MISPVTPASVAGARFWRTTFSWRNWPAWLALTLCVMLTAGLWHQMHRNARQFAVTRLQLIGGQVATHIRDRLQAHEQILRAGAALFSVMGEVNRTQWRDYVRLLALDERYPGVQGMGFARFVPALDRQAFEASVRAEGFPDFRIRPEQERDVYSAIEYLEPFTGRNLAAFGYDMLSESTRRSALHRSIETGQPALSGKVTLLQETHGKVQAGVLIYVPVFRPGWPVETVAQRWQALKGWVYSPFRMDDLMTHVLSGYFDRVVIDIFDGDAISPGALLFSSNGNSAGRLTGSALQTLLSIPAMGHQWKVRVAPEAGFFNRGEPMAEISFVLAGGVISLLLFFMVRFLRFRGDEAEALAIRMTHEIRAEEQKSNELAQRTRAILDSVVDGIITIDERGVIESLNPATERIFGWSANTLAGQSISVLMPAEQAHQYDQYLRDYFASGVASVIGNGCELEGIRRDGSVFPMDVAISEILIDGRRHFIGVVRDITERRRVEKMKNEFVSTVSHELRTPLTSIGGALGLMAGGALGEVPASIKTLLDVALSNCQRLTLLINDLLDMEKITAGKLELDMQCHSMPALLESAIVANKPYADPLNVCLVLEYCDPVTVRVDALRFAQVMSNFLSNAAKYSPPQANIYIKACHVGNHVRVSVKDQGPGIPAHFQSRVFEKFSQADSSDQRQKGGTGLGLAITRELVERMGGRVGFETAAGQGTTFWCELPVQPSDGGLSQAS